MLAVFVLPWFVPVGTTPMDSDSWAVGFSNRAAVIGIWVTGALLALIGWRARQEPVAIAAAATDKPTKVSLWALIPVLGLLGLEALMHAGSGFMIGDSIFQIDRAAYVLGGAAPYRAIEFPYGPGMLYSTVAGLKGALLLGMEPRLGYYVVFALYSLGGALLLYYVVNRLSMTAALKNVVFVTGGLFCLYMLSFYGNLQYTLVRCLAPYAALLALLGLVRAIAGGRSLWPRMAAAAALSAAVLSVSPEVGIAYAVSGGVLLTVICVQRPNDSWSWWLLVAHVSGVAMLFVLTGPSFFRSILMFGGGGGNLPVLPGPSTVLFVGSIWLVAYSLSPTSRAGAAPERAFAWGFCAVSVLMTLAALGRADFFHTLLNGFVVITAAIAILSRRKVVAARVVAAALAGCVVLGYVANPSFFLTYPAARWSSTLNRAGLISPNTAVRIAEWAWMEPADAKAYVAVFPSAGSMTYADGWPTNRALLAPLGFEDGLMVILADKGLLKPDFFHRAVDITSEQAWQRKLKTLNKERYVLVPTNAYASPPPARPTLTEAVSWQAYQLPVAIRYRQQPVNYDGLLVEILQREFEPAQVIGGYTILKRKAK